MPEVDVVVVGSGPNGLAAAVTLARSGLAVQVLEAEDTVGGGARTVDGLVPGVVHDLCSAVHPLALASPFFRRFDLGGRGLDLLTPAVSYGQALAPGRAALAHHDLARTAQGLGRDGGAWAGLMGPLVRNLDAVVALAMGDHRSVPRDLVTAARFGVRTLEQGVRGLWDLRLRTAEARALLTGVASHAITPLPSLAASGTALLLGALAHGPGWSVPRGGTGEITRALVADLVEHGGHIEVGREVRSFADLSPARAHVFDTTPRTLAKVLGDRLPAGARRRLHAFRYGDGAAKVDLVLDGPVPWRAAELGGAGTVHVGGARAAMVRAEAQVAAGRHPAEPMVLLSDPAVTDPSRVGPRGLRPVWTYTHVPAGSDRDMTEPVLAQLERHAPGVRDRVVAARAIPAARMSEHNANYVGGDISAGAVTMPRMLLGPGPALDPYRWGSDGVYLCSASVPPGPGVHGMGGWHAARRVLRDRFGITVPPDLRPRSRT